MSRSGYSDDCDDDLAMGRWRGVVASAIRGKRGQSLLKDLLVALDEMPKKELITNELKAGDNSYCTLGVLGAKRGINMDAIDPEDYHCVAKTFDIAEPLAQEIVYLNDEWFTSETPAERWVRMRNWVENSIKMENK